MRNWGKKHKTLLLIALNEINFDVVERYTQSRDYYFPTLRRLLSGVRIRTTCEQHYEELEPWIQWVSVNTGLAYRHHKVFRLGDIVGSPVPQMFEQLEKSGLRVGCISQFNTENRMISPTYFIPDPWTKTSPDSSWWSRTLARAIRQAVNDNALSHVSLASAITIALALLRFAQPKHLGLYLKLLMRSRGAPWRKAMLLDLLLHDVHMSLFKAKQPDFSTIFLNSGAHIQHHYFLNSVFAKKHGSNPVWYAPCDADPFSEVLCIYDRILREYLALPHTEAVIATGLSQVPYDRVKYYYRLKDHRDFLKAAGIRFAAVHPRMTRDFVVEFDNAEDAASAERMLKDIRTLRDGVSIFAQIENRGLSLFVTLTYPDEVTPGVKVNIAGTPSPLASHVAFVAIKNGMHNGEGFAFFTPGVATYAPKDLAHVKEIYNTIMRYFGVAHDHLPARLV